MHVAMQNVSNRTIVIIIMISIVNDWKEINFDIILVYTRNELASLAHSFYTYLKHQLIHLTIIVLLRLRSIYLGFIVVWSFIPRDTLYC